MMVVVRSQEGFVFKMFCMYTFSMKRNLSAMILIMINSTRSMSPNADSAMSNLL